MGRLSLEARARVVHLWRAKFTVKQIIERLAEEGVEVSRTAIYNLIAKFHKTNSVGDIKRRPRVRILKDEHYRFVDELMAKNTDLTSRQLHAAFKEAYPSVAVSVCTAGGGEIPSSRGSHIS